MLEAHDTSVGCLQLVFTYIFVKFSEEFITPTRLSIDHLLRAALIRHPTKGNIAW